MVQLTTLTPENDWSPATEFNLLESELVIVDTVMTSTTGDQSGGGNFSSTAMLIPVTQDDSDNIEIIDKDANISRSVTPTILSVSCLIQFVDTVGIMEL
jgi:hypothetical protein